jgi:hypothetical protein
MSGATGRHTALLAISGEEGGSPVDEPRGRLVLGVLVNGEEARPVPNSQ